MSMEDVHRSEVLKGKYSCIAMVIVVFLGMLVAFPLVCRDDEEGDPAAEAIEQARQLRDQGKHREAIEVLNKVIERHPKSSSAHYQRAYNYGQLEDHDRAIADYTKAIELAPNDANAYNNRGTQYQAKGDLDQALSDYSKAIKLEPGHKLAHGNRGEIHRKRGDHAEAVEDYSKAIQSNPKNKEAYHGRLISRLFLGDFKSALSDADHLLTLNPKDAYHLNKRGIIRIKMGEYDAAIRDFDQAIQLKPDVAEGHGNRAKASFCKGDLASAIDGSRASIKREPEDPYEHLWLFVARTRAGENAEADLASFRKGCKDAEWPTPVLRMYLGEITYKELLKATAHKDKETFAERKADAYFFLGQRQLFRNNTKMARKYFDLCIRTGVRAHWGADAAHAELRRMPK